MFWFGLLFSNLYWEKGNRSITKFIKDGINFFKKNKELFLVYSIVLLVTLTICCWVLGIGIDSLVKAEAEAKDQNKESDEKKKKGKK